MKELKLIVWDELSNYYFTPSSIDFEKGFVYECRNSVNGIYRKHLFKNVVLEEWTGLKDKHGVEIYEGDLVDLKDFNPRIYEVSFIEGAFCFNHRQLEDYPIDINIVYGSKGPNIEIIGHIHE
jgi:uncharacterized phage protein (TIGR01671 family)